jgi:hypothetical protein
MMKTRAMATVLAMAATMLAGCQGQDAAATPAAPATSAAPVDNGVAALTAEQIRDRAKAALVKAKSFTMKADFTEDGVKITADVKVVGKDAHGVLSFDQSTVEILDVAGVRYIKPNESFWGLMSGGDAKKATAMSALVADRWVKVPAKDADFESFFGAADVDELLKPDGAIAKGTAKQVDGFPTIGVVDGGKPGGTLYVATTGEPFPIRLTGTDGSGTAFSGFGQSFPDVTAPLPNEALDLAALTK